MSGVWCNNYIGQIHSPPLLTGHFPTIRDVPKKTFGISCLQFPRTGAGPWFATAAGAPGSRTAGSDCRNTYGRDPGRARGWHLGGFPWDIWTACAQEGFGRGSHEIPRAYCGASEQKKGLTGRRAGPANGAQKTSPYPLFFGR